MNRILALTLVLTVTSAPLWAQHAVGRDGSSGGGGGAEGRHSGGGGGGGYDSMGAASAGSSSTPTYTPSASGSSSSGSGSSAESRHSRHITRPRRDPNGPSQTPRPNEYYDRAYGIYGPYGPQYLDSRFWPYGGINSGWMYYSAGPLAWGYPFFGWSMVPYLASWDPFYWDSYAWGPNVPTALIETPEAEAEDPAPGLIRLMIEPEDASVYLDGYYMGDVGAFNGFHQRLRVRPGPHTLIVKREGFKTLRLELEVTASKTVRIRRDLVRGLDAEETNVSASNDVR